MVYTCPDDDICPNINTDDMGDQKKVTEDMINTIRCAIKYLADQGVTLRDMTDPEVGKRFSPPLPDPELSRGLALDGKRYKFSNATSDGYVEDLTTDKRILPEITTALWNVNTQGIVQMHPNYNTKANVNPRCGINLDNTSGVNQYWYVGYNRYKSYYISRDMMADPLNEDLPSVARAQTIVAAGSGTNYITHVHVKLHGTPRSQSPIYCEIRTTSGGKPTSTVLGRCEFDFRDVTKGSVIAFNFKNPVRVTGGTTYALVFRSPFTSYDNHFGLGGWGTNCMLDPCPNGFAWLSEDNGKTWIQYGKADPNLPYGEGKYAPADFAYKVHYNTTTTVYSTDTPEVVYFAPYRTNEVKKATIYTDGEYGPVQSTDGDTGIKWEVSNNFRDWIEVKAANAWTATFSTPYTRYVWVRATLSTTNASKTPSINKYGLVLETLPSKDSYLRTKFYEPETGVILGASCWSGIHAPVTMEPNTDVKIDIIRNIPVNEYVLADGSKTSFTLETLPAAPILYVANHKSNDTFETYMEHRDFTVDYDTGVVTFITPPPTGYIRFNSNPCWIRDLTPDDFPLKVDLFKDSFNTEDSKLSYYLKTNPVDPIREVWLDDVLLEEEVDYTCNPLTKEVKLTNNPGAGHVLLVKYTPFLVDSGVSLGYRMTRTNTTNQAYVEPNMFVYRV